MKRKSKLDRVKHSEVIRDLFCISALLIFSTVLPAFLLETSDIPQSQIEQL